MTGIILLGGGLDSTALLLHLKHRDPDLPLIGMHFQYGQKADLLEYEAVVYWSSKFDMMLKVFDLKLSEISSSAILRGCNLHTNKLEGRNVIFTMLAATYASLIDANELYLGYHKEPEDAPFPDATEMAAAAMQVVIQSAYKHQITLRAPFMYKSRTEILRLGFKLDEELITHTHTCYEDVRGGCGTCAHCKQRMTMINNMLTDKDEPLEENH